MTSPNQQQQGASGNPYTPVPSPNMGLNTPLPNPAIVGNNYQYFYGESYLNMVPQTHYYNGLTTPAMTATSAPQVSSSIQQNTTAPPLAYQNPPASAQEAHPSDVVSSLDEAKANMPSRHHHWHCPLNDATLPATDQEREQWVEKLLEAINNLRDIQGNQGRQNNKTLNKRWIEPLKGADYYLPTDKLILCWTIVDLAERLHRVGPSVLHSFDDVFWEAAAKISGWKFDYRMNRIIALLAVSKTRCDSLLGGIGMQSIVANPDWKLVATTLQANQNAKRGEILQIGRAARKQRTGEAVKRQKTGNCE
jgi:hypothetical protein